MRWRRIHDAPDVVVAREAHAVVNRLQRNFELKHDAVHRLQQVGGHVDIGRLQAIVGALHHEDAILTVGFHENRRHAAGDSVNLFHMRGVNAKLLCRKT